jgi:hypothetical protein
VTGVPLPRLAARYAQLEAEGVYATKKPGVGVKKADKSRKSLPGMNVSPSLFHEKSQRGREFEEAMGHSIKSSYGSQSFSTEAESKSIDVEPMSGIEQDLENGKEAQDLLNSVLSGFKDEDGRKFTDLSLAEASAYNSIPSIKRSINVQADLKEDPSTKRKYEDFSNEGIIGTRPSFKRELSFMSGTERSMSPKVRREEHARKRQIKKQALDRANAEAEALRKKLEGFEAEEAAAIAEEEAEVSA